MAFSHEKYLKWDAVAGRDGLWVDSNPAASISHASQRKVIINSAPPPV
jgi:hypothetical protein